MEPTQVAYLSPHSTVSASRAQTSIWDNRSIVYQEDLATALVELLSSRALESLPVYNWKWAFPYTFYYNLSPIKPNSMTADVMALMEDKKMIAVAIRHGDPQYVDPLTNNVRIATIVRVFSLANRFVCETVSCGLPRYPSPTDCPFEFIVQNYFTRDLRDRFQGFTFRIDS